MYVDYVCEYDITSCCPFPTEAYQKSVSFNSLLMIIVGGVAGGLLLIMVIIVISVTRHHKRKNKKLERELTVKKYVFKSHSYSLKIVLESK